MALGHRRGNCKWIAPPIDLSLSDNLPVGVDSEVESRKNIGTGDRCIITYCRSVASLAINLATCSCHNNFMQITVDIPDEIAQRLGQTGDDLAHRLLEIVIASGH